ncbi:conserved hypothetical protein [Desulforamulus reducens MI-1]|uniref:Uncharacterized protein n=1 Tax=Desulforamulus reducens (strain ATCC BAA-1160 / DSM 100696 / MI-1) TaxID=349161 RepID=A4J3Z4_DESRM|nr:hypothetical protein [Desulforamulus reducens]ABO49797.1 conserved hypothetical protein [Desulforamulus reducens MI-1]
MNAISRLIGYFKNPHGQRIQKLKERYQELDELSNVAVTIEDRTAYRSLQAEMREVFFDYLTAIVVDSIYRLVPHLLVLWIISFILPTINIPLINWQVNIFAFYFLAYFTYYIGGWLIKPVKKIIKLSLRNNSNITAPLFKTK